MSTQTVPRESIQRAHDKAMKMIDGDEPVAIFMLRDSVYSVRRSSKNFASECKRLAGALVGVYDESADSRQVHEDLEVFFKEGA